MADSSCRCGSPSRTPSTASRSSTEKSAGTAYLFSISLATGRSFPDPLRSREGYPVATRVERSEPFGLLVQPECLHDRSEVVVRPAGRQLADQLAQPVRRVGVDQV